MPEPQERETITGDGSISPERFARVREVFEAALDRPATERRGYVDGACGQDEGLRKEVRRMLAAEAKADPLLDRSPPSSPPPSSAPDEGRFPAGTILVGRYRILGVLGKGGMGEVYRAFDLILNQTVALKFLLAAHFGKAALERFRNEVRVARQVSHPNVCRVYDLGMVEGLHFLSMEYIDGEDLASLLRRIGRLPQDKAIEFTRKICAGLSAAHERGVLHRDLKPANIMIDGRGQVRITDFGLAGLAAEIPLSDLRSGTPAYMSPEQKAGKEVTPRSDIYSLGLVLHEMFTGKARKDTQSNPTEIVKDLDPNVEGVILRCLEEDPKRRPSSALNVAMGLPGADPIAAALAAGETPSPEMIAASGSNEGLHPKVAVAFLAAIAVGLAAFCLLVPNLHMLSQLSLEHPPEVLAEKAREIARSLGYTERPADFVQGFEYSDGQVAYLKKKILGIEAWKRTLASPPSPVTFWYRQSPAPITPLNNPAGGMLSPPLYNVPDTTSGAVSVRLDLNGKLLKFSSVPKMQDLAPSQSAVPFSDWSPLFTAAHLDMAAFATAEPRMTPPLGSNARAAWQGTYPGRPDLPVRVEAAAASGKPIYFEIVWPWTKLNQLGTNGVPPLFPLVSLVSFIAFVIACQVARYNWRTGRGDTRGALRVAVFSTVAGFLIFGLPIKFAGAGFIGGLLWTAIGDGVILAMFYLAVEPWARRQCPEAMITWSRILAGRWRDPAVSRDVLLGLAWAMAAALLLLLYYYVDIRLGDAPAWLPGMTLSTLTAEENLGGGRMVIYCILFSLRMGLVLPLFTFTLLVFLRMLLRNRTVATIVLAALVTPVIYGNSTHAVDWLFAAALAAVYIYAMQRFGVFVAMVYTAASSLIAGSLLTADFGAWYGLTSMMVVLVISALALAAFQRSQDGRAMFET